MAFASLSTDCDLFALLLWYEELRLDESARKCDRSLGESLAVAVGPRELIIGELLAEVGLCARRLLRERLSRLLPSLSC